MVLYFSATGNTEYVARKLAQELNDRSLDLRERIRNNDYTDILSKKPFVICAPVYVCEPPRFLISFLRSTRLKGSRDVYFVFTSGGYSGISDFITRLLIMKKKMRYKGSASITMPRNYIANNTYPELETSEIEKRILEASIFTGEIANKIRSGEKLKSRHIWLWEILVTLPVNPAWYYLFQKVKYFHVSNACISCGKCEQLCPLNVITLRNGKPEWNGKSCAHCMGCIQNCPVCAIEYGHVTQKKKRYLFKKYDYVLGGIKDDSKSGI